MESSRMDNTPPAIHSDEPWQKASWGAREKHFYQRTETDSKILLIRQSLFSRITENLVDFGKRFNIDRLAKLQVTGDPIGAIVYKPESSGPSATHVTLKGRCTKGYTLEVKGKQIIVTSPKGKTFEIEIRSPPPPPQTPPPQKATVSPLNREELLEELAKIEPKLNKVTASDDDISLLLENPIEKGIYEDIHKRLQDPNLTQQALLGITKDIEGLRASLKKDKKLA